MRVLSRVALSVALVCVAGLVGGGAAAKSLGNPCGELPAALRSACVGPGVTCSVKADAHERWEAVFATEATLAHAEVSLALARKRGLDPAGIETDVRCSNGAGVYEVGKPGFKSRAAAAALVAKAKAAGFSNARTEDS